jgi:hypothetical protein
MDAHGFGDASGRPGGREGEGEAVGTGGLWRDRDGEVGMGDLDGEDLEGGASCKTPVGVVARE